MRIGRFAPPPLTFLATALLALLIIPGPAVQAQTPPRCNSNICTVTLANAGSPVVDGCGEHATPGRMKVIFSSTNSSVTRASFPTGGYFIRGRNEHRRGNAFTDWEWRAAFLNNGRWQDPAANRIGYAGGKLGDNIVEVRPKAGAHIWSNRNARDTNQGPVSWRCWFLGLMTERATQSPAAPTSCSWAARAARGSTKGARRSAAFSSATGSAERLAEDRRKIPNISN